MIPMTDRDNKKVTNTKDRTSGGEKARQKEKDRDEF